MNQEKDALPSDAMATIRSTVPNFRDIGGYPASGEARTRPGKIFRSSDLSHCGPAQWTALRTLGIRTVIDLRDAEEVRETGGELPADFQRLSIEFHPSALPCAQSRTPAAGVHAMAAVAHTLGVDFMVDMYRELVVHRQAQFQEVLAQLAEAASEPVLIHCTAGKDRTGIAIALLLEVLGVDRDTVIEDYLQTNAAMKAIAAARMSAQRGALPQGITDVDNAMPLLRADVRYLSAALSAVDTQFGGVMAYLAKDDGLTSSIINPLHAALLDGGVAS